MKKIKLIHIINLFVFLYVLSLYLFTYREGFNNLSNFFAAILISLIWVRILLNHRPIIINKFSLIYLVFIFFVFFSIFVAITPPLALGKGITLVQLLILMFTLINYIDSKRKILFILKAFVWSGFIASIYILITSDFSNIARFGNQLGNVNAIGMILSISLIFSLYFFIETKTFYYIPIVLVSGIVILLTGSRKSLLFVVMASIVTFYGNSKTGIKSKLKFLFLIVFILILTFYVVMNFPVFYNMIGRRMISLYEGLFSDGTQEDSFNTRKYMIEVGWQYFSEKPLFGYGIDNYRELYQFTPGGSYTYSHNNYIELLVGIGLFGTLAFYISYIYVIIKLFLKKRFDKPLQYTLIAITTGYILLSPSLVFYDSKHLSIIIAVSSVIPILMNRGINNE